MPDVTGKRFVTQVDRDVGPGYRLRRHPGIAILWLHQQYRHIPKTSFCQELDRLADRPSLDPVVLLKRMLIGFSEKTAYETELEYRILSTELGSVDRSRLIVASRKTSLRLDTVATSDHPPIIRCISHGCFEM